MSVADWVIMKGRSGYHLHHSEKACNLQKEGYNSADPGFYGYYAYVTSEGVWMCPCCHAVAPDEIAFIAELVGCPHNHNEFIAKVERHERRQRI